MAQEIPQPQKLVLTEADQVPSPEPTLPERPAEARKTPQETSGIAGLHEMGEDYHLLVEVKNLANRVGGLVKLRSMVDVLINLQR
jgi:hypothetical protein